MIGFFWVQFSSNFVVLFTVFGFCLFFVMFMFSLWTINFNCSIALLVYFLQSPLPGSSHVKNLFHKPFFFYSAIWLFKGVIWLSKGVIWLDICTLFWTYMVKRRKSGIINNVILVLLQCIQYFQNVFISTKKDKQTKKIVSLKICHSQQLLTPMWYGMPV